MRTLQTKKKLKTHRIFSSWLYKYNLYNLNNNVQMVQDKYIVFTEAESLKHEISSIVKNNFKIH